MNTSAAVLVFATMLAVVGMAQSAPAASPDDAAQPWHPDSLMARPVEVRYVQVVVDAVVDDPSLPADALGGGSWKGSPPLESDGDRVVIKDWSLAMLAREGDTLVELVDGRTINGRSVAYTTLYAGLSGTSMSVPVAGQDLVVLPTGPDGALFTGPFFGTDHLLQVGQGPPSSSRSRTASRRSSGTTGRPANASPSPPRTR